MKRPLTPTIILAAAVFLVSVFASAQADVEDESKWQKSYLKGAAALFVDNVELDDSSQRFQVQVSVPVVDPATGKAIGAVTFGIDAEGLLML